MFLRRHGLTWLSDCDECGVRIVSQGEFDVIPRCHDSRNDNKAVSRPIRVTANVHYKLSLT